MSDLPDNGSMVEAKTYPSLEYDRPARKVRGKLLKRPVPVFAYEQCWVDGVQVDPETVRETGDASEAIKHVFGKCIDTDMHKAVPCPPTTAKTAKRYTHKQILAFRSYQNSSHRFNEALRGLGAPVGAEEARAIAERASELAEAIAASPPLPEPKTTYRAITFESRRDNEEFLAKLKPDAEFLDAGFVSTSGSEDFVHGFLLNDKNPLNIKMVIDLPKGTRTAHLTDTDPKFNEDEYLLSHDARFLVKKIEHTKTGTIVHLTYKGSSGVKIIRTGESSSTPGSTQSRFVWSPDQIVWLKEAHHEEEGS